MKIETKHAGLSKIASDDQTRYILNHIAIVRTGETTGHAEATDGKRLVRVPVEFDATEALPAVGGAPELVTVDTWNAAVKLAKGKRAFQGILFAVTDATVNLMDGSMRPRVKDAGEWPKTDQVIPDVKAWDKLGVISFDARMLAEMAAVASETGVVEVVFDPSTSASPIMLAAGKDTLAILMPCRTVNDLYRLGAVGMEYNMPAVIENPFKLSAPAPATEAATETTATE